MALPGRVFCRLAWRLTAYQSVTRARALAMLEEHEAAHPGTTARGQQATPPQPQRREEVPATRTALESTEAFNGIFSFG